MYELIVMGYTKGVLGGEPWCRQEGLKFLCPVPGYDRHFAITENFGFEMISIPMDPNGPDMDLVEAYVRDPKVKGIWCVPLYSNPSGICYSDETVRRFAALQPAADDFRIYWDNAYCVHHLYPEQPEKLLNIFDECRKQGTENMVYEFFSTSKVTAAGDGIGALVATPENLVDIRKQISLMTVGFGKVNQLRHVRFLKNREGLTEHMAKHASILRPKFETVLTTFEKELGPLGIAEWTEPRGGYFISLDTLPGCAKRTVELCKQAGVVLTPAGSTYPYKQDPEDKNIRIAPTYPTPEVLLQACQVLTVCVRLATVEKMLAVSE
jgi:DNA-binding transcriptional MocR family regulator